MLEKLLGSKQKLEILMLSSPPPIIVVDEFVDEKYPIPYFTSLG